MLKRLAKETGIHCNAHSFRRGFCIHNVKSGLSTRVVQALGGWETISITFQDSLKLCKLLTLTQFPKLTKLLITHGDYGYHELTQPCGSLFSSHAPTRYRQLKSPCSLGNHLLLLCFASKDHLSTPLLSRLALYNVPHSVMFLGSEV